MKVKEVCDLIETSLAPLSLQEHYDNCGLQVGDPESEVTGILVCLDVSESVISEAVATGCNMIVSHHPLIFHGLKQVVGANLVQRCLAQAIRSNVSIYSGHTNVDNVVNGVSEVMCKKLGLVNTGFLEPLPVRAEGWQAGSGKVGELTEDLSELDFLSLVKSTFACGVLRHSALTGRKIRKVAVCGGAGADLIENAVRAGADAFITADLKYHDFMLADGRLLFIDAGHYETEQYTKELFFEFLSKNISTFATRIAQREVCPVKYFQSLP